MLFLSIAAGVAWAPVLVVADAVSVAVAIILVGDAITVTATHTVLLTLILAAVTIALLLTLIMIGNFIKGTAGKQRAQCDR